MKEKITLCGNNCIECPRYNAHTDEELNIVALKALSKSNTTLLLLRASVCA